VHAPALCAGAPPPFSAMNLAPGEFEVAVTIKVQLKTGSLVSGSCHSSHSRRAAIVR